MDPWGALMAILVAVMLSVPAALVYRRWHTRTGALAALIAGSACALAAAILGNLAITPLYAHITLAQVAAMIVPFLLPFNLIKFAIHAVVTFIIYKPISNLLDR
jgi:riboflavin transporter FmnP